MSDIFFGKKLKEMRLKYAKMGLRKFAETIEICPSELSKIEHGYMTPPYDKEWLLMIYEKLGFDIKVANKIMNDSLFYYPAPDEKELYQLWRQPFVVQKMSENFIPAFVCTADENPLSEEKMTEFVEYINNIAKEHNKRADEYNNGKEK